MVQEYNLKDIEYEKWDHAFDDYNASKSKISDLTFDTWYKQQCYWLAQKQDELFDTIANHSKLIEETEELSEFEEDVDINIITPSDLATILQKMFYGYAQGQMPADEDEHFEDDEWDAWDNDHEDPNNLL